MPIHRKVTLAVAGAAMTVAAAAPTAHATGAGAQEVIINQIKNVQTGRCLDASISGGVVLKACNKSEYQQWERDGNSIANIATGLCLDGSITRGVRILRCSVSEYQDWGFYDSHYATAGNNCLDGSLSQGVTVKHCDADSPYQTWVPSRIN